MITKYEKDWKIVTNYKRESREPINGDRSGMSYS